MRERVRKGGWEGCVTDGCGGGDGGGDGGGGGGGSDGDGDDGGDDCELFIAD